MLRCRLTLGKGVNKLCFVCFFFFLRVTAPRWKSVLECEVRAITWAALIKSTPRSLGFYLVTPPLPGTSPNPELALLLERACSELQLWRCASAPARGGNSSTRLLFASPVDGRWWRPGNHDQLYFPPPLLSTSTFTNFFLSLWLLKAILQMLQYWLQLFKSII